MQIKACYQTLQGSTTMPLDYEVNSPVTGEFQHKGPVTRFPFDDVIMNI